jgi:hypothetical protein
VIGERFFVAAISIFFLATHGPAQDFDFEQIEIQTDKVADNIYMLSGGGGNIGVLVGEDGVLIIDSMFAELEQKIKIAISELSDRPVRYLLTFSTRTGTTIT